MNFKKNKVSVHYFINLVRDFIFETTIIIFFSNLVIINRCFTCSTKQLHLPAYTAEVEFELKVYFEVLNYWDRKQLNFW